MALSIGSVLAGRYEISAPIAVGGMGEVWRARDRVLDRPVAAKVLRSEFTGDPNFLARFRNEARHTAQLSHPNIASVYDYGETYDDAGQSLAFLVMEYVEGQPLVTILHEEGRLPVDWTLHVLGQAAEGLSAAHRAGVVHRDIKPGNLIVRPDGVVKLTDFGIAQARDATPLTRTGMVVGTAQYLSPEQAQGFPVTAASDVYSLGVVAYECLTGARPFDGTSQIAIALAHINQPPPPLPGDVPPAVRALISRALAKEPADRFPDGGAFADAIRAVASGGPLPGGPPPGGAFTGAAAGLARAAGNTGAIGATRVVGDPGDAPTRVFGAATAAGAAMAGHTDDQTAGGPHTTPGAMPPLAGPPVDEEADGYYDEAPRRRRWPWLVGLVVVLLIVGGVAAFLLTPGGGNNPGARDPGTPTSSSAPATVFLRSAAYIGKPADQVSAQLEGEGLKVKVKDADAQQIQAAGRNFARGDVVALQPHDQAVPVGSSVTLFAAPHNVTVGGSATTTHPAPTTTSAPTTTTPPTTTSAAPTTKSTSTTTPPTVTSLPTSTPTLGGTSPSASSTSAPASSSAQAAGGSGGTAP